MCELETEKIKVEVTKVNIRNGDRETTIRRDNLVSVLKGALYYDFDGGWNPIGDGTAKDIADALCSMDILEKKYQSSSSGGEMPSMFGSDDEFSGYSAKNGKAKELLDKYGKTEKTYFIKPRHGDKTKFNSHEDAKEQMEKLEERNKDVDYEIEIEEDIV